MVKISEIFSTSFQTSVLQDPTVTYIKKMFFFYILVLALEMAVLELFWWKHSQGPLGVKWSALGGSNLSKSFTKYFKGAFEGSIPFVHNVSIT